MENRNLGCGADEPLLLLLEMCEGVSESGEVGGVEAASLVPVPEPEPDDVDAVDDRELEREGDEDEYKRVDGAYGGGGRAAAAATTKERRSAGCCRRCSARRASSRVHRELVAKAAAAPLRLSPTDDSAYSDASTAMSDIVR